MLVQPVNFFSSDYVLLPAASSASVSLMAMFTSDVLRRGDR